jgi:lipopolysaccharide/colanic/teichoic acid biosynthesis glycosyltransferase
MGAIDMSAKRLLDVVVSAIVLVVIAPALAAIGVAVFTSMGRPVLFRQLRPGLRERPFRIWKFRTMTLERDDTGVLLPDGEREHPLGRWLRERSLDELPQLVNVLLGDMSLVGPRPLIFRYLDRYTPRQRLRHAVKPGITGWAQVNGRNALDWANRLEHDVWYVEHQSFALDLRILGRTLRQVLTRSDVCAGGGADLDEFWGTVGVPASGPRAFPVDTDERS